MNQDSIDFLLSFLSKKEIENGIIGYAARTLKKCNCNYIDFIISNKEKFNITDLCFYKETFVIEINNIPLRVFNDGSILVENQISLKFLIESQARLSKAKNPIKTALQNIDLSQMTEEQILRNLRMIGILTINDLQILDLLEDK